MKVKELVDQLNKYNQESIITINCPDTNATRNIWYVEQDEDPEHANNFIDIVLTKENEEEKRINTFIKTFFSIKEYRR